MLKIRDKVKIKTGEFKGKTGEIIDVLSKEVIYVRISGRIKGALNFGFNDLELTNKYE